LEKQIKELEKEIVELCAKEALVLKEKKNIQLVDLSQDNDKLSLPFEKAMAME